MLLVEKQSFYIDTNRRVRYFFFIVLREMNSLSFHQSLLAIWCKNGAKCLALIWRPLAQLPLFPWAASLIQDRPNSLQTGPKDKVFTRLPYSCPNFMPVIAATDWPGDLYIRNVLASNPKKKSFVTLCLLVRKREYFQGLGGSESKWRFVRLHLLH